MRIQKRTLFIGVIVWLLFFGWWFRGFLFQNWQFRLFSVSSWRYLIREFRSGWYISSKSDWIFVFSFILAPFIFAFLWYWAQKVKWKKVWKKIWKVLSWPFLFRKREKLKKETAIYTPKQAPEPVVYRPRAVPVSGNKISSPSYSSTNFLNNSTAMGNFPEPPSSFPEKFSEAPSSHNYESADTSFEKMPAFTNKEFAEMADTPLSEIEIPQMDKVNEDIEKILEQKGYTIFTQPAFQEKIDFFAASSKEILLVKYDLVTGDWLADEESFNDEDPLWFSETDHRISPVFQLKMLAKSLQDKLEKNLYIRPVLIEKEGIIINAEDMMKTWNDLGVSVCRTALGGPVELPTGTELFNEEQEKISPEALENLKSML